MRRASPSDVLCSFSWVAVRPPKKRLELTRRGKKGRWRREGKELLCGWISPAFPDSRDGLGALVPSAPARSPRQRGGLAASGAPRAPAARSAAGTQARGTRLARLRSLGVRSIYLFCSPASLLLRWEGLIARKKAARLFSPTYPCSLLLISLIKSAVPYSCAFSPQARGLRRRGALWKRADALQWRAGAPHPAGAWPAPQAPMNLMENLGS